MPIHINRRFSWTISFTAFTAIKIIVTGLILMFGVYGTLLVRQGWDIEIGGVNYKSSPYKESIPGECLPLAQIKEISGRTAKDAYLLRGRVSKVPVEQLYAPGSLETRCLGYKILVGIHYPDPRGVNFIREWVDEAGTTIVSMEVKYVRSK